MRAPLEEACTVALTAAEAPGGILPSQQAISLECVHREFNAALRDLRWSGSLGREACKVLEMGSAGAVLDSAFISVRGRLQDALQEPVEVAASDGKHSVNDTGPCRNARDATRGSENDIPELAKETEAASPNIDETAVPKNKKPRRGKSGSKTSRAHRKIPTTIQRTAMDNCKLSKRPAKVNCRNGLLKAVGTPSREEREVAKASYTSSLRPHTLHDAACLHLWSSPACSTSLNLNQSNLI